MGILHFFTKKQEDDNGESLTFQSRLSFEKSKLDEALWNEFLFSDNDDKDDFRSYFQCCAKRDSQELISLEDEIDLLAEYIRLQELMHTNVSLRIEVDIEEWDSFRIPAFTLFPLVQNAFASTYFSSEKLPLRLKITAKNNVLFMEVSNRKNPYIQDQYTNETIQFLQARLKILYPTNHELILNSNSHICKATLRLDHRKLNS